MIKEEKTVRISHGCGMCRKYHKKPKAQILLCLSFTYMLGFRQLSKAQKLYLEVTCLFRRPTSNPAFKL
jgi:mannose-6-phosphate isomerase class I